MMSEWGFVFLSWQMLNANHKVKVNKVKDKITNKIIFYLFFQCFLCSFAGVKISNMHRHYCLIHGYDKSQAEKNLKPDPDHPGNI